MKQKYKVRQDGTYSTIVKAHPRDTDGVTFTAAKRELKEEAMFHIREWRRFLQNLNAMTPEDVE